MKCDDTALARPAHRYCCNLGLPASRSQTQTDICDELAGRYPKDFVWTGWHPNCMCYAVPIVATEDEYWQADGTDFNPEDCKEYVSDVPDEFKEWVSDNAERIETAKQKGTLPYFLKDNTYYIQYITYENRLKALILSLKENEFVQFSNEYKQVLSEHGTIKYLRNAINSALSDLKDYLSSNGAYITSPHGLSWQERVKWRQWLESVEKNIGIKRGKPMSLKQADKQNANPLYHSDKYYKENCQSCVPAFLLRLWGFDVQAKGAYPGSLAEWVSKGRSFEIWRNLDGTVPSHSSVNDWMQAKGYKTMNEQRYKDFYMEMCAEPGLYEVSVAWKKGGGHVTVLEKLKNGSLKRIEPQVDKFPNTDYVYMDIDTLCKKGKTRNLTKNRGIMRIDNKILDMQYLDLVIHK